MLRRLQPLDRLLFLTLVPLWLVCLVLHVHAATSGRMIRTSFYFYSAESAADYPIVARIDEKRDRSGFVVGDRLLRLGQADLRGATWVGFYARLFEAMNEERRVTIEFERSGERMETIVQYPALRFWWWTIPPSAAWVFVAAVLLLGAPQWRLARRGFLAFILLSIGFARFWGPGAITYLGLSKGWISVSLGLSFTLWFVHDFPERHSRRRRVTLALPWLFGASFLTTILLSVFATIPYEIIMVSGGLLIVAYTATLLWFLTRNYVLTEPAGRRQVKWFVYAIYVAAVPWTLHEVLSPYVLDRWLFVLALASTVGVTAGAACALIAIFGYRFLDIDRLISSTASYSILTVGVLAVLLAIVPGLAGAVSVVIGVEPASAQLALSVLLAAVAVPAHRSLRPLLDRTFFPERPALEDGIERLLQELSSKGEPRELTTLAGEQLDTLLRPESCVVYARAGPGFEPVFVKGRAIPPAIDGQSPLVTTLQGRSSPLASDRLSRRDRIEQLSPFDRAALETLGAAVVVPIRRRAELAAFLCLGHKRSGDIYTGTDLALLMAVASTVSTQLERFDQEEVAREARAMQEELRRYVPGAIARGLDAGEDLEPRERAVTVLFVDIRGYSSYSESRRAREIFAMVTHYAKAVSSVVEKFGGSVVEFNGDGMMAVFGAPRSLADKERAAVAAGRTIIHAMASVDRSAKEPESAAPLAVAVGIATGAALVGSIQAVDRRIWTALGNTTNLAARLQGLTRELDASMVIDLATWRAAGEEAADLERHEGVSLRGRAAREDVYLLPLPGSVAD